MGEPQSPADKTSRWAFTAYEAQWPLFNTTVCPEILAEIGWQVEVCPDTQREHYQGYLRTTRQVRFAQLKKIYPGVHLEPAKNWDALVKYCKKTDTAKEGTQHHHEPKKTYLTMSQALTKLTAYCPSYDEEFLTKLYFEGDEKKIIKFEKRRFWEALEALLCDFPDEVGIYTQPQYERTLNNLWKFYSGKCLLETQYHETDRQTDIPVGVPAFEN